MKKRLVKPSKKVNLNWVMAYGEGGGCGLFCGFNF